MDSMLTTPTDDERIQAAVAHLAPLIGGGLVVPIGIKLVTASPFVRTHANRAFWVQFAALVPLGIGAVTGSTAWLGLSAAAVAGVVIWGVVEALRLWRDR